MARWDQQHYERIIRAAEAHDARRRNVRPMALHARDSLATLMLATLAVALGLVVLGTTLVGLFGAPLDRWNEPCPIMTSSVPPQFTYHEDPGTGHVSRLEIQVVGRTIYTPTNYCAFVALMGMVLGGIALIMSRSRRGFSAIAAIGVGLCLMSIWLPSVAFFVLNLIY